MADEAEDGESGETDDFEAITDDLDRARESPDVPDPTEDL